MFVENAKRCYQVLVINMQVREKTSMSILDSGINLDCPKYNFSPYLKTFFNTNPLPVARTYLLQFQL